MSPTRNLIRAVADVVNVDQWIEDQGSSISVHIDVVFRSAPVGGAPNDTVSFRMELRRAELVIHVPNTEGLNIISNSMARENINKTIEMHVNTKNDRGNSYSIGANAAMTNMAFIPGFAANSLSQRSNSTSRSVSEILRGNGIEVQHRRSSDGNYRWEMIPTNGQILFGSGWDANAHPRFSLQKPQPSKLERNIIVQIRCLREDIVIQDIRINKPQVANSFQVFRDRNKIAVAEAYIKTKLLEQGLVSGDISNRFAEICLLETVVAI